MRTLVVVLLASVGIFGMAGLTAAQVTSFIAQTLIIDGRNYVAGQGLVEAERKIADAAAKAPEGWDVPAQNIFRNMIFATAAQLATLKAVGEGGGLRLPITIGPGDLSAAVLTWDTSIDNNCLTPTRIAKGEIRWSDVLLFSGDYEKLFKITSEDGTIVRAFRTPTAFASMLDRTRSSAAASGRSSLIQEAVNGQYFKLQQFLLGIKADLLTEKDAGVVTSNSKALAVKLNLR